MHFLNRKKMGIIELLFFLLIIFGCFNNTAEETEIAAERNIYYGQVDTIESRKILIGIETLNVEIVSSEKDRMRGLMYRNSLREDSGMFFVFEYPQVLSFWMKNTKIPLDIAFVDSKRIIMEIQQLEPYSESTVKSTFRALYALEVNRGWFDRSNVNIGDSIIYISE